MAETIKMCNMNKKIATQVFMWINSNSIRLKETNFGTIIVTDVEPKNLFYPEGWYYAKGSFRNKHTCTTGCYEEVPMEKSNGDDWGDIAKYSTLD